MVQPMKLPAIITSDTHFTASPVDEYRWSLWPWLAGEIEAEKAESLMILGDLTDAKDYHPAELVNRITGEFRKLLDQFPKLVITVLAGNHDWLKQGGVFFKFLEHLGSRIRFVTKPFEDTLDNDAAAFFLPYSKNPVRDWGNLDFSHYDYLFMHQTVTGSIASNGQAMDGEKLPPLNASKVYSGDIHVPQTVGVVEYIGSPYHVHHGDDFKPRVVLLDRKRKAHDLRFETIRRLSIRVASLEQLKAQRIQPGDHVKCTLQLARSDFHDWKRIRREAAALFKERAAVVHGLALEADRGSDQRAGGTTDQAHPGRAATSPVDSVTRFVVTNELGGDLLDAGLEIVEDL